MSPGSREPVTDVAAALAEADRIGYPVMVKAAAGGGGIGMGVAAGPADLRAAFETARSRAERFFGSPEILLERYVQRARHVEVQILGLADGQVLALGERDCSVQRRHQKVAEETPSPGVDARAARADAGRRRPGRPGRRVPGRRDGRVPGGHRRRLVRVPGDEHPAAGRAPRHRARHRHRPGRAAVPHRRGPAALVRPGRRHRRRGTRSSCGSTPRTRSGSCPAPARSPGGTNPRARASGSTRATRPATP